ncbi:spore wall synthesis complex protein [Serinicoccus chungangensis]
MLEQMEQALYAEDPRLASQLKRSASAGGAAGLDRRRLVLGVLVALGGLALVVVGVMSSMIWIGVIGFLAMVLGGAWAASPTRSTSARSAGQLGVVGKDGSVRKPTAGARRSPRQGTFMQRMEQQWDRRREQGS